MLKLNDLQISIAVSGLKTGDNPQPGIPVIRSLRAAGFKGKIIGFVYDAMESGIYLEDIADEIYQMPYPSTSAESFLTRLGYINSRSKIDVIIPTLDSEIPLYIRLQKELQELGIHTFICTEKQFNLRDKSKLFHYFTSEDITVPKTVLLNSVAEINKAIQEIEFPVFIKGHLYEAYKANNIIEAQKYFLELQAKWGLPVILQELIEGDEFNVVILGDGKGNCLGMVPQRKLVITDKGKGFGGVVVNNPALEKFAQKVIKTLSWRGPCELEIIKDKEGVFHLLEINPRFPAWVRLAEGCGQNQPAATVLLALGNQIEELPPFKPGVLFIRHSEDIISNINLLGEISVNGELIRKQKKQEEIK